VVDASSGLASRARRASGSGPYRSTVPAQLASWRERIPADLAADAEEAVWALGRFDAFAQAKLGTGGQMLGPMSAVLLRTESTSSSQIENLTVGARQLALAELGRRASTNADIVLGNVHAMVEALRASDRLDEAAILEMHRTLMAPGAPGALPPEQAGRYRAELVWVGTSGLSPRGASHVAPQPELVAPAMADLVAFMAREDLPVLVQAAIAHAQFETIHPFADGNGRIGRALVHALLRSKGVLAAVAAPLSAGLLTDTERYFDALTAYRTGDAGPIVAQFAAAGRFAARSGTRLVEDLVGELDAARDNLRGIRPQAAVWRVLPHLVAQPVIDVQYLVRELGLGAMAAARALATMAERGVIVERSGGGRGRVWQHSGILAILDGYAAGLRRR
jgi:Fic family protein